jgi:hypothetical protein
MEPHFIDNEERQRLRAKIEKEVSAMGYPPEFGTALAAGLGTERAMEKMLHYLTHADMPSMEEIADEMVAICDDRSFWREKKEAEFYQNKYNEMLWQSKFEDDEDE